MTHRPADRGQATVETVLVLPVVCLLLLGVVQIGLLVRDRILVTHAAREAARAAAVSSDAAAAPRAALAGGGLDPARTSVQVGPRGAVGTGVSVTVSYRSATDVALVGVLLPDLAQQATVTMRVER
ncbi:MAG: pilus assembly protein [Acidimicrobiales bacterium]|nr:pilus assembly protein [Acidimicrobiales bacterium]